jgi:catechol 2,3-dioxygenase-like lactoylglutathione lyase family enzyme
VCRTPSEERETAEVGGFSARSSFLVTTGNTDSEGELMMTLDHVGFAVSDYQQSKTFYERALAPLGITLLMEFSGAAAGFGKVDGARPSFFIEAQGEPVRGRLHIALKAENRAQVDAFHAAALEAGGTDNGAPGVRAVYHPDYYGGYVLDPDGNNVEAVCHEPEP